MANYTIVVEQWLAPERRVKRCSFEYHDRVALAKEAKTIGDAIRKRRVEEGLTQSELALILGTSSWSINEWESGHFRPVRFRAQVTKWLGVSAEKLLNVKRDIH